MPGTIGRRLKFYTASPIFLPLCAALINFTHAMNTYCKWQSKRGTSASWLVSISFTREIYTEPSTKASKEAIFWLNQTPDWSSVSSASIWSLENTLSHVSPQWNTVWKSLKCVISGFNHACPVIMWQGKDTWRVKAQRFISDFLCLFCYIALTSWVFTI